MNETPSNGPLLQLTACLHFFGASPHGGRRFWEFFTVNTRNANTRRAYFKAVEGFAAWCDEKGLEDLSGVTPMHIAAYRPADGGPRIRSDHRPL